MRLIAGLGNPGKKYQFSRHNLGFMVIDRLGKIHQAKIFWPRFQGRTAKVRIGREDAVLLKPYTYMNLAGESVKPALKKFRLGPENLIVIHDDLDLNLGQIKIGFGLGSAGHNGIESIIEHLGTKDFYRIRLGIGKPSGKEEGINYVLSGFPAEEKEPVEQMIADACQAIQVLITEGVEQAKNLFHRRN